MAARFTAQDVLQFLDSCLEKNPSWVFIDLGHPFVYTASSRLTLYADDARWAIVSEVSGYDPRAGRFLLTVTALGNCLERLTLIGSRNQFTYNAEFITLIEGERLTEATQHFASAATSTPTCVRATDAEKRRYLPAGIPELMKINEWYHRSWYYGHGFTNPGPVGDAPSSYETYRLIAEVLANRDPSRYRPTLKPNSHWSHWPHAGSM
jgi:uncharacterized protein DUF7003